MSSHFTFGTSTAFSRSVDGLVFRSASLTCSGVTWPLLVELEGSWTRTSHEPESRTGSLDAL